MEAKRRDKAATALQARCRGMRERVKLQTTVDPLDTLRRRARAHLDHKYAQREKSRLPPCYLFSSILPTLLTLSQLHGPG